MAGSWDGIWLGVPARSQHQREAAELLRYLTGKDGHPVDLRGTETVMSANLTELTAQARTPLHGVETVYAASITGLRSPYLGPRYDAILAAFQLRLREVDAGTLTPDAAFQQALADAKALTGG